MGLSALVLAKKNSNIDINSIIKEINEISQNININFIYNEKKYNKNQKLQYVCAYINDSNFKENSDRTIMFDIYDEKFYDHPNYITLENIPNILESEEFFRIIIVDEFLENEDLLFVFLYNFLKRFPELFIWIEEDWIYTLDDLVKINLKSYFEDWCYINPKEI